MPNEIIPSQEFAELLAQYWNDTNSPRPKIIDLGDNQNTMRIDLDRHIAGGKQDLIVIMPGSPTLSEEPIGNWTYGNRMYNLLLGLYSINNKQRLYNMMAEIRRICHFKMHATTAFQRIQFADWEEMYEDNAMFYVGNVTVLCVNNAVLLER